MSFADVHIILCYTYHHAYHHACHCMTCMHMSFSKQRTDTGNEKLKWSKYSLTIQWIGRLKLEKDKKALLPVWMQEAYNLPLSKHSFCCPIPGGIPSPSWGTPCPDLGGGTSSLAGGTPSLAEDTSSLTGGTTSLARGVPGWGTPWEGTWDQSLGYPWKGHGASGSIKGWRWGTPEKGHETSGSIMGWDGVPHMWTDRHLWKQYLSSYYVREW